MSTETLEFKGEITLTEIWNILESGSFERLYKKVDKLISGDVDEEKEQKLRDEINESLIRMFKLKK